MTLHPQIGDKLGPDRAGGRSRRRSRACASSTRRVRSPIRPTATTASSTWWRSRCCSAGSTAADYEDAVAARSARRCVARARCRSRRTPTFTQRILRARQALHRQCGAGVLQGRQREPARAGGLSDRAPQAAGRGHAGAGQEIRGERRVRISAPSRPSPSRKCSPTAPRLGRWR